MAIGIYIRILSLKGNIIHEMSVKENETRYFIFYFFSSSKNKKTRACVRKLHYVTTELRAS